MSVPGGARISLASSVDLGGGYKLRRVVDLQAAIRPVRATIQQVFLFAGTIALVGVIILTWVSSRVIVHPVARMVRHLRNSELTGTLTEFDANTGAAATPRAHAGFQSSRSGDSHWPAGPSTEPTCNRFSRSPARWMLATRIQPDTADASASSPAPLRVR